MECWPYLYCHSSRNFNYGIVIRSAKANWTRKKRENEVKHFARTYLSQSRFGGNNNGAWIFAGIRRIDGENTDSSGIVSKESWPKRPGFDFIPKGFCLPYRCRMEYWNGGYERKVECHLFYRRSRCDIPIIPSFQCSNTPRHLLVGRGGLSLTCTREASFRC